MIRHLLRSKLGGFEAPTRLLLGKDELLKSPYNRPTHRKSVVVHEGLLNLEMYHLPDLIKTAKDEKLNFYYLRQARVTLGTTQPPRKKSH